MSVPESQQPALVSSAVYSQLARIARERLELKPEQIELISPQLLLVQGLQLDSLAQVTFIAEVENEFGFELDFQDRERVHTVDDLVQLIMERSPRGSLKCE